MIKTILESWYEPLKQGKCIEILESIIPKLDKLYEERVIYPKKSQVFRVFQEVPFDKCRVVLLGMDPYHNIYRGVPSACGIAFATENGFSNPSLKNLQKELKNDLGEEIDNSLKRWLEEGVLLLNTSLTVEEGLPGSHIGIWREFSKEFFQTMNRVKPDLVYMLLGLYAQSYQGYIKHCIKVPHPSPLSRGFIGSAVYSKTNELLENLGQKEIKW